MNFVTHGLKSYRIDQLNYIETIFILIFIRIDNIENISVKVFSR